MSLPEPREQDLLAGRLLHNHRHLPEHTDENTPRVVFAHGLFGRGRNWDQIGKALTAEGAISIQLDLPNHGQSHWTDEFDYVQLADQLAGFIRREGPSVLVGHSMGGKISMLAALRHPDLISKLVVVDIPPGDSAGISNFSKYIDDLLSIDLAGLRSRRDAEEQLAARESSAMVRAFLLQNLRRTDGWSWEPNLELLRRSLPEIGGWPGYDGPPYEGPVLWLNGADSPYVQPEHDELMRELFPATRQVRVKGAGHWVHSQKPELVTAILTQFVFGGTP